MTETLQWTFNDGWILMSVYLAQGEDRVSLHELIGAADAMNHAIPTCGELSRALTRLASCGVLTETNGQYCITNKYLPEIEAANDKQGGLFATPDKGRCWLARTRFNTTEHRKIDITDEQLSVAGERYRKLLRRST